jgi:hypothetical protein
MEEEFIIKIKNLEEENKTLKNELEQIKEHLKKYTSPERNKIFYKEHKEEILSKQKSYVISSEKKKEYARKAYLNKKEKLNSQLL